MSTTIKTVVLSRKALEIGVRGLNLDMETLAQQINETAEMREAGLTITADELEYLVRISKIKSRNIKRAEKTVIFVVSEEEGPVGVMRLPNLVIRITQPNADADLQVETDLQTETDNQVSETSETINNTEEVESF